MNEDGTLAQNYGCLPSGWEIIQMKRDTGNNWACHDADSKVCTGLCLHAKENNLDVTKGDLIHELGVHASAKLHKDNNQQ